MDRVVLGAGPVDEVGPGIGGGSTPQSPAAWSEARGATCDVAPVLTRPGRVPAVRLGDHGGGGGTPHPLVRVLTAVQWPQSVTVGDLNRIRDEPVPGSPANASDQPGISSPLAVNRSSICPDSDSRIDHFSSSSACRPVCHIVFAPSSLRSSLVPRWFM
jgi:hypothetical protein